MAPEAPQTDMTPALRFSRLMGQQPAENNANPATRTNQVDFLIPPPPPNPLASMGTNIINDLPGNTFAATSPENSAPYPNFAEDPDPLPPGATE